MSHKYDIVELETPVGMTVVFTVPIGEHVGHMSCSGCRWDDESMTRKAAYEHAGRCRVKKVTRV